MFKAGIYLVKTWKIAQKGEGPKNFLEFDTNWRKNFEKTEKTTANKIEKFLTEVLVPSYSKDEALEPWVLGVQFSD